MKVRLVVLTGFLLATGNLVWGVCMPLFSSLSINDLQYPVQSMLNYPPPLLSGIASLNVQFHSVTDVNVAVAGVSLRYEVDNHAVGSVLTDSFVSTLDTTKLSEGAHSLSVIYTNEPAKTSPCYVFSGRQYTFVVSNGGRVITGPRTVPVVAPLAGLGPVLPQFADFVVYPGTQPHSRSHSFPAQVIAPAGGITPADLWSEALLSATSNSGESLPAYWQLRDGSIIEDPLFTSLIGCDDLRMPGYAFDVAGSSWEQRKGHFDGGQDDVSASSYSVFTPNLDGPGFYGISMDGRLFLLGMDGSVRTLAGPVTNRNVTPLTYLDGTIPMSSVQSQQILVGKFDVPFYFPTDLVVDPGNHAHIFVADMNNHRIALVDLSVSPPVISTYAGIPGFAGYSNGPAALSLFNQPSSIAIARDGTLYLADAENSVIRKIDADGNVTTLVGLGPILAPTNRVAASSPLTYAPRSAVPFASAYINYPNAIRFDSKGNLVLAETVTQAIRYVDLSAKTVTTIAQFSNVGSPFGEQVWLDVDRNGNIGNRDDIIASMVTGKQSGLYRVPITGTTAVPLPKITTHSTIPLFSGHTKQNSMPWTSGPWSVSIDDQEGRLVVSGVQSAGVTSLRLLQANDPVYQLDLGAYVAGKAVWLFGTVPGFPFGSRPSFAAVHGYEGHSGLGNVLNFDDMVSMTDTQLGTYLQGGADGAVPRPEIAGNDLRNLIYFIRRTATGGDLAVPGATSTDKIVPAISAIGAAQNGSTSATMNWTTNEAALGFVAWGTASGTYFGWSAIESSYSMVHSVSVPDLPAGQRIYFVVHTKDQAGNQSVSVEQSLALR